MSAAGFVGSLWNEVDLIRNLQMLGYDGVGGLFKEGLVQGLTEPAMRRWFDVTKENIPEANLENIPFDYDVFQRQFEEAYNPQAVEDYLANSQIASDNFYAQQQAMANGTEFTPRPTVNNTASPTNTANGATQGNETPTAFNPVQGDVFPTQTNGPTQEQLDMLAPLLQMYSSMFGSQTPSGASQVQPRPNPANMFKMPETASQTPSDPFNVLQRQQIVAQGGQDPGAPQGVLERMGLFDNG
jgi:hypothetical protein